VIAITAVKATELQNLLIVIIRLFVSRHPDNLFPPQPMISTDPRLLRVGRTPLCLHEPFYILGCQLWPLDSDREVNDLAGKLERHLIILVIHR
jgi:hypothetical protein